MVKRFVSHFLYPDFRLSFELGNEQKKAIENSIRDAEIGHKAEIVVHIECSLPILKLICGASASDRAQELFSLNRVWDTEGNTGIFVYLLLSEHALELVFDRGIQRFFPTEITQALLRDFRLLASSNSWTYALVDMIKKIGDRCRNEIPISSGAVNENINELPDKVSYSST